jgi:hypothetical protein
MAMTYTELQTNVKDITEMTFTDAQLSMFTKQVEQRIYGIIKDLPILRTTFSETFTASSGKVLPADCLYVHSVTQQSSGDTVNRKALVSKDLDFLLEAYPLATQTTTTSDPEVKYYALNSSSTTDESASRMVLTLAPKWATSVTIQVDYQYQPRSIVDTDGTEEQPWLGTNYDTALLNGVLVEAAKFMKAEPDMVQMYEQQFVLGLQQLQNTVDVRLKSDSYRPQKQMPKPIPMPQPTPEQQGQ